MPVLLLHGGFDPTMPMERVEQMADGWPDAQFVAVPWSHHVTFNEGSCPKTLTADFLRNPGAPMDDSCIAEMEPFEWSVSTELEDTIFLGDLWGVRRCSTAPARLAWPALALLALFVRRCASRG